MSHSPWWRRPSPEQEGSAPSTDSKPPSKRPASRSASGGSRSPSSDPPGSSARRADGGDRGRPPRAKERRTGNGAASAPKEPPRRQPPRERPPATAAAAVSGPAIVLCDVETVANVLRDANLELESAPAALAAAAGEAEVRRVYALGNRFSRLRRVLEDAGYERVMVEGSPAMLRMQLAVDAVDLGHRHPESAFLIAAPAEEIQPVIDRLVAEKRSIALFGPEALADLPAPESEPSQRREKASRPRDEDIEDEAVDDEDELDEDEVADDDDLVEDAVQEEGDGDGEDERTDDEDDERDQPRPPRARRRSRTGESSGERGGEAARERAPGRAAPERAPAAARFRVSGDPFDLLLQAIGRIVQGPPRLVFESVVRQEILELEPSFNEREVGFGSFTEFFEEAQEKGLVQLEREPSTGTYLIVGARLAESA